MIRLLKLVVMVLVGVTVLLLAVQVNGQTVRKQTGTAFTNTPPQQPLFTEYKGVRLGMTAAEVQTKFGVSGMRADNQELFVFNDRETAQVVYDAANKVIGISVDYLGGVGAPDYRDIVGPEINTKPDGSMYKVIWYKQLGFWVSYSRTAGPVSLVSITISKIQ